MRLRAIGKIMQDEANMAIDKNTRNTFQIYTRIVEVLIYILRGLRKVPRGLPVPSGKASPRSSLFPMAPPTLEKGGYGPSRWEFRV